MRILKITGLIFLLMNLGFFGTPLFLDDQYDVSYTHELHPTSLPRAFNLLADYQEHPKWNPWFTSDTSLQYKISDPSRGLGASYAWTASKSAPGMQKIVEFRENEFIAVEFDFGDMGTAKGSYTFVLEGDKLLLTWRFWGAANGYIGRYITHFMDSMMVPVMKAGLTELEQAAISDLPVIENDSTLHREVLEEVQKIQDSAQVETLNTKVSP